VNAATWPRPRPEEERLLVVDPREGTWADHLAGELPRFVGPGDVVVVNDAATIPASLSGETAGGGDAIEVRLLGRAPGDDERAWSALLFGRGSFRERTEDRAPPPPVGPGTTLRFGGGRLGAEVRAVEEGSRGRVVTLVFDRSGAALWSALYRVGRPVQYAYTERELPLWHVQNVYASRPWAVEMASAGRALTWNVMGGITRAGARLAAITHAAGLSSTGDPALDRTLPRAERYAIPAATVGAIREARRVIAVGTSVVRALEGCAAAHGGELVAGEGETSLLVGPGFVPRVVDGLLTGMHDPAASHHALMLAFAPAPLLDAAHAHAERDGYFGHEFGDHTLVLDGALGR
jgi:S-adenosylmethionine:tRNA ribosyltransferase-isomerase